MPNTTTNSSEAELMNFMLTLPDLVDEGESMPPTFICKNKKHQPHHVAVGLEQKKLFNEQFGCKKWKAAKST